MRDERGLSSGVQVTLLFPLAFGVLLLALQWALVSWADATALAAAQDGARVASGIHGTTGSGRTTAAGAADNGSLTSIGVVVDRSGTQTAVTVSGHAISVVPGWNPAISRTASRPTERVTSS